MVVVKVQRDGECPGRLGGCQHDHEQGNQLAIQAQRIGSQVLAAESNEINVGT